MARKKYTAILTQINPLTPRVSQFIFDIEDRFLPMPFEAGQFITFDLPIHEKRQQRMRSYSIANSPQNSRQIELGIGYLENGLASEYWFNKIKVGEKLTFKGPGGVFVYPKEEKKNIVMIATGTGVVPFKSMIDEALQKYPEASIHLIFGTQYAKDILYLDYFNNLAQKHTNFTYEITLSREQNPLYKKGYVHTIYLDKYKEAPKDTIFMLCGWSNMVDEAVAHLKNIDIKEDKIRWELYG